MTVSCNHALCLPGTRAMKAGLTSPLLPSPAFSKPDTKGQLLGGQRAQAGAGILLGSCWVPLGFPVYFLQEPYLVRPSQSQAAFQASLCVPPEQQNWYRVTILPSMGPTMNSLYLLGPSITLSFSKCWHSAL